MADGFDACLAFTLREEGGYVDDPADPLHWPRDPGRRSKVRPAHARHRSGRTAGGILQVSLADFAIFGTGWLDRTEARRNAALAMIAGAE
jgi:lysozyme family protein